MQIMRGSSFQYSFPFCSGRRTATLAHLFPLIQFGVLGTVLLWRVAMIYGLRLDTSFARSLQAAIFL